MSVILGMLRAPTPPHNVALSTIAASGTLSSRRCDARQPNNRGREKKVQEGGKEGGRFMDISTS